MSFVERFIILCPYLGESTIAGSTVCCPQIQTLEGEMKQQEQDASVQVKKLEHKVR